MLLLLYVLMNMVKYSRIANETTHHQNDMDVCNKKSFYHIQQWAKPILFIQLLKFTCFLLDIILPILELYPSLPWEYQGDCRKLNAIENKHAYITGFFQRCPNFSLAAEKKGQNLKSRFQ